MGIEVTIFTIFRFDFWVQMALICPSLALSCSPWPPVQLPRPVGVQSRPGSNKFRLLFFPRPPKNSIWTFYLLNLPQMIASDGIETIIKRSASKFCISGYRRRVKRKSWFNFMAKTLVFLLVCITSLKSYSCRSGRVHPDLHFSR